MNQRINDQPEAIELCPDCGSAKVVESMKEQSFPYGADGNQVTLKASVPVFSCDDCGYEYFGEKGEEARHEAVCRYLGVQTPEEIRKTREAAGLSRTELCELAGFGSASLQRWETGAIIPNGSSDRLIFLLRFADNVERLKRRLAAISQGVLGFVPTSVDPHVGSDEEIPAVHLRCGIKRFDRLAHQPRVMNQSASWSLRRRSSCT